MGKKKAIKRTQTVTLRLTMKERMLADLYAKQSGLGIGPYGRKRVLMERITTPPELISTRLLAFLNNYLNENSNITNELKMLIKSIKSIILDNKNHEEQ